MSTKIYKMSNGDIKEVSSEDESNFLEQLKENNMTAEVVLDDSTLYDEVKSTYSKDEEPIKFVSGTNNENNEDPNVVDNEQERLHEFTGHGLVNKNLTKQEVILANKYASHLNEIATNTDPNVLFLEYSEDSPEYQAYKKSQITSGKIETVPLGEGADFAASIPNETLTLENGFDYYNLRTEANLFNNHYDSNYLLKLKEQQDSVPQTQRNEDWDGKQDLYELYDQNSGYIPLYGDMDDWDAKAHARNKEVKDAIFSGEYGYNPHTDELTKLETPIDVSLYDQAKAYQQVSEFETYNEYVKGQREIDKPKPLELHQLNVTEKPFVDEVGADMFAYGFVMEQTGDANILTGAEDMVKITAMNGKTHILDLDSDDLNNELIKYNKFIEENYEQGGVDYTKTFNTGTKKTTYRINDADVDTHGEMFLEHVRPDEKQLNKWAIDFNNNLTVVDQIRQAFGLSSTEYSDSDILAIYADYNRYEIEDGKLYYTVPGSESDDWETAKMSEAFGNTELPKLSIETYSMIESNLKGIIGDNYKDLLPKHDDVDYTSISHWGKVYDEMVAVGYYMNQYKTIEIDGEVISLTDENVKKIGEEKLAEHIKKTDEYKEVLTTLYSLDSHNNNKNEYIQDQARKEKQLMSLEKPASEEVEFMASNLWNQSKVQKVTYKDMVFDKKNMSKEVADLVIEVDVFQENLKDFRKTALKLEEELLEMGADPIAAFDSIAEKYNIVTLEDWQNNKKAQKEWNDYEKNYSKKLNEFLLLTTETIPLQEKLLNEKYEKLDTKNYTLQEMKICLDVLKRDHEPGKYWTYQGAKAVYRTIYGGGSALGAGVTDVWLEVWGEITGRGPDDKNIPLYNIIKPTNEWMVDLNNEVIKNIEYEDSFVAKRTQFSDIDDFAGAMDYLLGGAIDTSVILGMAFLSKNPKVVGAILGTYGGSEKYNELRRARDLFRETDGMYGQDFNVFEMLLNATLTGTAEAYSERFTFGQWKRLGYFANNPGAKLGFKQSVYKNIWTPKAIARYTANFGEEGFTEVLAQFASNTLDVAIGVEGVGIWDGIDEAFINGAFISTLMHAPQMFNQSVIQPFIGRDANQRVAETADEISELMNKKVNGKSYDQLTKEERKPIDDLILKKTSQIEEIFTKELYKVDLLSKEHKQELININQLDFEARKKAQEITNDPKLSEKEILNQIHKLEKEVALRAERKDEILKDVDANKAEKLYNKNMGIVKDYVESAENDIDIDLVEVNIDEYAEIVSENDQGKSVEEVEGIVIESEGTEVAMEEALEQADTNINDANANIEQSNNNIENANKEIEKINNDINTINKDETLNNDQKKNKINNEKVNIKNQQDIINNEQSNIKDQEVIIKNETANKEDAVQRTQIADKNTTIGNNILSSGTNSYGMMIPVYDKSTGNIQSLKMVVNRQKSIEDGMWTTPAHEFTHAAFANTLRSDPKARLKLGGAMKDILNSNNIQFKNQRSVDMFNKRVAQYNVDKQGEEALAIVSEMLLTGDAKLNEGTLGKIGSMFRRWSMENFGTTYKFNNSKDINNFIKDYYHSIKNNKPSKAISKLLSKGAKGKMFEFAKSPQDRKNMDMHSLAVNKTLKTNPDLKVQFDDLVRNKDGSKKHINNKDFKASTDYIDGYSKIVDSKLLDGLIQVGMTERGLPPAALKDFTRKVKEELGLRYLNNYNLDKNDSLFGWLAGTAGGAGRSIIYRAKGDVMNQYLKEEARTSIDKAKDDTGKIADMIQADKDILIDKIENADMSPAAMKESIQDVNDLIMVMDMLGFPSDIKKAVRETVRTANIPLEDLTYKGIRDLLLSTEGKATSEKNVTPDGPLFEVLNAISAEFGIDPLRVLAKQDLNSTQRVDAQKYIFSKAINDDGSFNTSLLDALPEGQDRDGRATGVANTKLGQFYTKGERLKVKEGAKKGLGQKFAQNKRKDIRKEEFLDLFGINSDGTFQSGTKADGAIRELVVQISQLSANQEIRLNAIENKLASSDIIAKLKDGASEIMFSKIYEKYIKNDYQKSPADIIKETGQSLVPGSGKNRRWNEVYDKKTGETWGKARDRVVQKFSKMNPKYRGMLRQGLTGGNRSSVGTVGAFDNIAPSTVDNEIKIKRSIFSKAKLIIPNLNKLIKSEKFKANEKNKLNDLKDFFIAIESYLKTNPKDIWLFGEMLRDSSAAGQNHLIRILAPFKFYAIDSKRNPVNNKRIVEEHTDPQNQIGTALLAAAIRGNVNDVFSIIGQSYMQGAFLHSDDLILAKNKLGSTMPKVYFDKIIPRLKSGDLKLPPGMSSVVRLAVGGINLNNYMLVDSGQTMAEFFGINIEGKVTDSIVEFQNNLVIEYLSGNITKADITEAIKKINTKGISYLNKTKEVFNTRNKLVEINNATLYNKPVEVKGMSTFDFDDTLARTKSGVRFTMPNDSQTPAAGRKVVFLAGSAGSGKSNVITQLGLKDKGFKVVNQDIALEWLVKNSGLPTDMRDFTPAQSSKWGELQWEARDIAQKKAMKFRGRGDGVVVDGTGASTISMFTQVQKYKDAGYDVQMLFVDSSLENALTRNQTRKERSLKDFIVERNWKAVQKNKKAFKEEFGNNFVEVNTDNLKQGDPMPSDMVTKVDDFTNGYIKGRLTAEEFANQGSSLLEQGAKFDFSEFNKVVDGTPGPLLQKARNRAKKFGTKDMFVLTARPQESAFAIQQFLTGQGLDIPIKNITGLANSTGQAKAQWMLDKFAEGYNDMYFVDDALANVEAVKTVLDQLDIKSKVVQAKLKDEGKSLEPGGDIMYSKVIEPEANINNEFNNIIERKKGVDAKKRFSSAEARKRGAQLNIVRSLKSLYIPPSAEDFKGLLYYFIGKGKQGDSDLKFFKDRLLTPFAKGIRSWNSYKQNMVNEYNKLKKQFPDVAKNTNKKVPGTRYTNDTAIRVYLWDKSGFDIPGISKSLKNKLVKHVNNNPNIKNFADGLSIVTRRKEGYAKPNENWVMESIPTDLRNVVDKIGRKEFLQEWVDNKNEIFSPENINKIEVLYGANFKSALLDVLYRMENGSNRKANQSKLVNNFTDWVNGSVGAIMFFNTRSALLQTMSTVNFVNWSDNNIFKASAAFANQPRFWKDFVMLFNSPQLKQRRKGLQTDVSAAELTKSFAERGYNPATVVSYLLQKGFLPTQVADSFAIAFGGASFYRNRYNKYIKQGMSAKEANDKTMLDFQEIAEETQQSSREDLISQEQASPLGRLILAFQNVTMQYGRLNKKALSDLVNGRGDMKTNVSKVIFYGAVNNIIFSALQSALAFMVWGGDEEEIDDKTTRTFNSALDSFLRGTGIYGAFISTLKNTIIQWDIQSKKGYGQDRPEKIILELLNLSPPIGSKIRKIINAYYSDKFNKGLSEELGFRIENPKLEKWANIIEATTNIPLARLLNKANNLEEAITSNHETWKRIAMFLGWNGWSIDAEDEEVAAAEERIKEKKEIEKEKEKEQKEIEKEKEEEEEKIQEEKEKKEKGIKTVRCSGIRSNGERCGNTTETAEKTWKCYHHMDFKDGDDRDGDGIKEYRCTAMKKNGDRCKNKTENKSKKCYAHQ